MRKLPQRQQQGVPSVFWITIFRSDADPLQTVQQRIHGDSARAAAEDELRERLRIIGHLKHRQHLLALAQPQQGDRGVRTALAIGYALHGAQFHRWRRGGDPGEILDRGGRGAGRHDRVEHRVLLRRGDGE